MLIERFNRVEYFCRKAPQEPDVNPVSQAVEGQLAIHPAILYYLGEHPGVQVQETQVGRNYSGNGNGSGRTDELCITEIGVEEAQLRKEPVIPALIIMRLLTNLRAGSRGDFAGLIGYGYVYCQDGTDNRLTQHVKMVDMPPSFSPVFASVEMRRYVLGRIGDITYGRAIFHEQFVTKHWEIQARDNDPVFLAFTPDHVLATTYKDEVLKVLSYDELREAGIVASFTDGPETATLALAAGRMTLKLRLGKRLRPDYPTLMFSDPKEWITNSGITVGEIFQEVLN